MGGTGGGQQIVSQIYTSEDSAKNIAQIMNNALKEVGAGSAITTDKSSKGGYRIIVAYPSVQAFEFDDYVKKKKK